MCTDSKVKFEKNCDIVTKLVALVLNASNKNQILTNNNAPTCNSMC